MYFEKGRKCMKSLKKFSALLITVMFAATLFAGCSSKQPETTTTLDTIKKAGTIKFGLDDSYPPFESRNSNNELVGFDIDLGNAIAAKIGVKAEFVTTDFNGIILALNSNKFDAILSALSVTDERKKEIAFAGPYINSGQVIVIKGDNTTIKSSADLKGKIVAAQLGSTGEAAAKKIEGAKEVKTYDKVPEELQDLLIGRVDAVIVDKPVGGYYTASKKDQYKILDPQLTEEPIGIGVRQKDADVQKQIQSTIEDLQKDGTLSKLSIKWFGYDAYTK